MALGRAQVTSAALTPAMQRVPRRLQVVRGMGDDVAVEEVYRVVAELSRLH